MISGSIFARVKTGQAATDEQENRAISPFQVARRVP
jgi:hypothetical protein